MRSFLLESWKGENRESLFLPRIRACLASGFSAGLLFVFLGAAAMKGATNGDTRFAWLTLFAALSFYAMRKEAVLGFLLLGVSWVLSTKVPLPWESARYIFVKADDILTILLLLSWAKSKKFAEYAGGSDDPFAKSSVAVIASEAKQSGGRLRLLRRGVYTEQSERAPRNDRDITLPLGKPILIFLNVALVSMLIGLMSHCIDKPWYTLLNFLKWCQYFVLFFLAFEIRKPLQGLLYTVGGMAVATTVLQVFGFWEHFHPLAEVFIGNYYRLFERPPFLAQANHFGIFLVMGLSFALPLFVWWRKGLSLVALLVWSFGATFMLTWTYSRMSYLALALSFFVVCLAIRRARIVLASICLFLAPVVFSSRVWDRILSMPASFHGGEFSSSVVARMQRWDVLWESVRQYPLLGTGIGSRERIFYESFWMQLLCETGIVGTVLFVGVLMLGFGILMKHFAKRQNDVFKLWMASFFGIFFAMLLNGVTLVNFVITVLAAPFWTCFGFMLREAVDGNSTALAQDQESYAYRS